jgi:hypothetical protein
MPPPGTVPDITDRRGRAPRTGCRGSRRTTRTQPAAPADSDCQVTDSGVERVDSRDDLSRQVDFIVLLTPGAGVLL